MGKRKSSQRRWEVEKIVDCKLENGEEFYEVKWVDYEETTWEPIKNLQACEDALDEFHSQKQTSKPAKETKKTDEKKVKSPKKLTKSVPPPKIQKQRKQKVRRDSAERSENPPATRAKRGENENETNSGTNSPVSGSRNSPSPGRSDNRSGSSAASGIQLKSPPPPLVPVVPRSSQQRAEDVEGLRSDWEPQSILTCYEAPDDIYYVVKWKNIGNPSIVSSTNLRQIHPDLLITYLQEKLNCAMQRGSGSPL